MIPLLSVRCRILLASLLLLGCSPLCAQAARANPAHMWPVDSVLSRFEADTRANVVQSVGSELVFDILDLSHPYLARKDSLLAGLEVLALTSSDRKVRQVAAARIAIAGEVGRTATPRAGVLSRLLRIYGGNTAWVVRSTVMDRLPLQADRGAAAAFLRSVAAEPDSSSGMGAHGHLSHGDLRIQALARLAEMGDVGRAVLQSMHRSGEARSPQARLVLAEMAQRGFPVRDIARRQP